VHVKLLALSVFIAALLVGVDLLTHEHDSVVVGYGCTTPTSTAVAVEEDLLPSSCVEVDRLVVHK